MVYLRGDKICFCGLAEVLSPQITKKIGSRKSQLPEVSHLRQVNKSDKLFKSVHFRNHDLRKFFADLPLCNLYSK
jgi:hypothetical protein